MINYGKFQFASAPSTGCLWFTKAAQLAGLGYADAKRSYGHFEDNGKDKLKVSLVRNPCVWLYSLYNTGIDTFIAKQPYLELSFTQLHWSLDFSALIDEYLEKASGEIGKLFFSYKADSFIRVEDFPKAFVELAESVCIDPVLLQSEFFHNKTDACVKEYTQAFSKEQWRAVHKAEKELCEYADYY